MVTLSKNHLGLGRAFGLGAFLVLAALVLAMTLPPPALAGVWSPTGSLSVVRRGHTATLLNNGKVLVAGGEGDGGTLASAALYSLGSGAGLNLLLLD